MPQKIRVLSEETINQIAAGEVVENPASVVKELVENAIDAGATHLTIDCGGGGFQHITVIDNGSGMNADDALLCLERHATSKINLSEDLESLKTMGFRGEALASIAAISKMTLTTAEQDRQGVSVEVEGGKICRVIPAARTRGTTMEVRSLFYNVPARKQFQKSMTASSAEITRMVTHLALAHVDVGFELIHHNKVIFSVASTDELIKRVHELLGGDFTHPIDVALEGHTIQGLMGSPQHARSNRSGQYVFVNRRPVVCLPITYAIREAYATRIDIDRHPIFVLHIGIPPALIDVNVHPQKREIRLREESVLKNYLRKAVNASFESKESHHFSLPAFDFTQVACETLCEEPLHKTFVLQEPVLQTVLPIPEEIKPLGVHAHYLIVEASSVVTLCSLRESTGIVWIDLMAAAKRIAFERCLAAEQRGSQGLLFPISFACSKAEAALLSNSLKELSTLGIHMRAVGPAAFLIETLPVDLEEKEVIGLLHEIAAELPRVSTSEKKMRKMAELVAMATRPRHFSLVEAVGVLKELMKTQDPFHCPQGKDTLYHVRKNEIDHYFSGK